MAATARPTLRKPWTHGAAAYHEADSIEGILAGLGRIRNPFTALIRHETHGVDGVPCAVCGLDLAGPSPGRDVPDTYAMVDVNPRTKRCVAKHYYCAWGGVMEKVMELKEVIG